MRAFGLGQDRELQGLKPESFIAPRAARLKRLRRKPCVSQELTSGAEARILFQRLSGTSRTRALPQPGFRPTPDEGVRGSTKP